MKPIKYSFVKNICLYLTNKSNSQIIFTFNKNGYTLKRLNIFTILIAILFSTNIFALSFESVSYTTDKNGKRTGFWALDSLNQPVSPESPLKMKEGYYVNGRKKGVWVLFFKGGKVPRVIGEYNDNRPSGAFFRFKESGELVQASSVANKIAPDQSVQVTNDLFSCRMLFDNKDIVAGQVFFAKNFSTTNKSYNFWMESNLNSIASTSSVVDFNWLNSNYNAILTTYLKLRTPSKLRVVESGVKPETVKSVTLSKQTVISPAVQSTASPANLPPVVKSPKVAKGLTFMPNGFNKLYTESNEIWMDGHFENGQLKSGKVFIYDKDGILLKVRVYKDGKYESDGVL